MARMTALILFALWGFAPALAQEPDSVFLEDFTWTELRDLIASGKTTVILPIGGVEQSGPDMALGKHDARAHVLSERIARELGNALVAPVVAYVPEGGTNPPTSHMRFPGTLTVPSDAFRSTVESIATSLKLHGFKDIVVIGEHGSYQGDLRIVTDRLNRAWSATPVRAHFIAEYYRAATSGFGAILSSRGYSPAEIGTHAGVADTSLTLALDPRLVRQENLHAGAHLDPASGVYGDPRRSSAELGRLGVEEIVKKTIEAIKAGESRPRPAP